MPLSDFLKTEICNNIKLLSFKLDIEQWVRTSISFLKRHNGRTDGWSDGPKDGPTDRRTNLLVEVLVRT